MKTVVMEPPLADEVGLDATELDASVEDVCGADVVLVEASVLVGLAEPDEVLVGLAEPDDVLGTMLPVSELILNENSPSALTAAANKAAATMNFMVDICRVVVMVK